jgi:hypothetical protein
MTIALGVIAPHVGIAIAADTEESVEGFWKVEQGKIRLASYADATTGYERAIGVSVSGSPSGLCDALTEKLVDAFAALPPTRPSSIADMNQASDVLAIVVRDFHDQHILPMSATAQPPAVRALIAAQFNDRARLWTTEHGTILRQRMFGAIGIGDAHAGVVLKQFWDPNVRDVFDAVLLAGYAVYHAKEFVSGCGKFTHIAMLQKGNFVWVEQPIINAMDEIFRRFATETEPLMMRFALGGAAVLSETTRSLRHIRKEVGELRNQLKILSEE